MGRGNSFVTTLIVKTMMALKSHLILVQDLLYLQETFYFILVLIVFFHFPLWRKVSSPRRKSLHRGEKFNSGEKI